MARPYPLPADALGNGDAVAMALDCVNNSGAGHPGQHTPRPGQAAVRRGHTTPSVRHHNGKRRLGVGARRSAVREREAGKPAGKRVRRERSRASGYAVSQCAGESCDTKESVRCAVFFREPERGEPTA
ncbi:MAG: hypothetical protein OXR67_00520 [Chloroflexota bacterium]|nr:hypothetical protein [Chloroflexota bacterium]